MTSVTSNGLPSAWQDRIGSLARHVIRARESTIFALLGVVTLAVWLQAPRFLSVANIRSIFLAIALLLVLAVGSTVGVSAMVAGLLFKGNPHISEPLVFMIAVAVGATVGSLNGLLITLLRV